MKVLYIKANPKTDEESRTFRISEHFIREYKKSHPEDEIITLDLYKEDVNFLDAKGVQLKYDPGKADDPMLKYALQFKDADKYVFAEPFWNLGIPSILKAYIDYICITKLTFAYTAEGPVGLLKNKKCVNIITRGGAYSEGPFAALEMGDKYLRNILGFLGITDYTTISADMLDVIGVDVERAVGNAMKQAEELAKTF
jgi:FMN-dependent NADH-azoreductase